MEFYDRMYNKVEYICTLYENVLEVGDDMELYNKRTINGDRTTTPGTTTPRTTTLGTTTPGSTTP